MKKVLFTFLIYLLLTSYSFADNWSKWCLWSENYTTFTKECNEKEWWEMYECRVSNLCKPCNNKDSKKIFEAEEFKEIKEYTSSSKFWSFDILKPLSKVQKIYKANLNSIYKCVLIDIQERWLENLKQILSATDKTQLITKEIQTKISTEKTKLAAKKASLKCSWWSDDKSKDKLIKKNVLDQVSVEYCNYSYYLLYLKEYYTNNQHLLWISDEDMQSAATSTDDDEPIKNQFIISNSTKIQLALNNEIIKINKIFPLAYYAYSEYEDNYLLHLLLTLIKQDYVIVREQLAKVLWPINQVAYKIKDAMKKY